MAHPRKHTQREELSRAIEAAGWRVDQFESYEYYASEPVVRFKPARDEVFFKLSIETDTIHVNLRPGFKVLDETHSTRLWSQTVNLLTRWIGNLKAEITAQEQARDPTPPPAWLEQHRPPEFGDLRKKNHELTVELETLDRMSALIWQTSHWVRPSCWAMRRISSARTGL